MIENCIWMIKILISKVIIISWKEIDFRNFYYCCSTIIIVAKRGKVEWELLPLLEGKSRPFCFRVSLGRAPNSLSPKSREYCENTCSSTVLLFPNCKTQFVPLREYSNVHVRLKKNPISSKNHFILIQRMD